MSAQSPRPTAHEPEPGNSLNRRMFLKTSVAAGSIAAGGLASSGTAAAVDNYCAGSDNENCALDGAVEFITGAVDGLFSSGYDKDDTADLIANNQHWEIYESMDDALSLIDGWRTEVANWTKPGTPSESALADLVWGEVRTRTFTGIQNGKSASDLRTPARQAGQELLSTQAKNIIRQWNEFAYIVLRHIITFPHPNIDDIPTPSESDYPDHADGEAATSLPRAQLDSTPEDLSPLDVYQDYTNNPEVGLQVLDYTLPNGETQPMYVLEVGQPGGGNYQENSFSVDTGDSTVTYKHTDNPSTLSVYNPDGDSMTVLEFNGDQNEATVAGWTELLQTVESVADELSSDAGTYVDNVVSQVDSGDIDAIDILSPADYAREFGDANGLARLDAEMAAMGMQAPSDVAVNRTLSWTDSEGNTKTASGAPYLSWNWTTLESWEYSYDSSAHVLTVETDSVSQDGVISITYDDTNSTTVSVDMNNLDEDGKIDVSDSAPSGASVASIALDLAGELNSFWAEGQTITVGSSGTADTLILGYENDNGEFVREWISGEVTLEDAGEDNDRMQIQGYNTQTRDPARSIEQAKYYDNQREDTTDLEDDSLGLPGVGELLSGGGLLGLGIIGIVILAVIGVVADTVPGLGN